MRRKSNTEASCRKTFPEHHLPLFGVRGAAGPTARKAFTARMDWQSVAFSDEEWRIAAAYRLGTPIGFGATVCPSDDGEAQACAEPSDIAEGYDDEEGDSFADKSAGGPLREPLGAEPPLRGEQGFENTRRAARRPDAAERAERSRSPKDLERGAAVSC